jgi:hypothetical protein
MMTGVGVDEPQRPSSFWGALKARIRNLPANFTFQTARTPKLLDRHCERSEAIHTFDAAE